MLQGGKTLELHYKEYLGAPPWRGFTKFVVDSIITVRPAGRENRASTDKAARSAQTKKNVAGKGPATFFFRICSGFSKTPLTLPRFNSGSRNEDDRRRKPEDRHRAEIVVFHPVGGNGDVGVDQPAARHVLNARSDISHPHDAQCGARSLRGTMSTAIRPPRKQISTPMAMPNSTIDSTLTQHGVAP